VTGGSRVTRSAGTPQWGVSLRSSCKLLLEPLRLTIVVRKRVMLYHDDSSPEANDHPPVAGQRFCTRNGNKADATPAAAKRRRRALGRQCELGLERAIRSVDPDPGIETKGRVGIDVGKSRKAVIRPPWGAHTKIVECSAPCGKARETASGEKNWTDQGRLEEVPVACLSDARLCWRDPMRRHAGADSANDVLKSFTRRRVDVISRGCHLRSSALLTRIPQVKLGPLGGCLEPLSENGQFGFGGDEVLKRMCSF